MADPKTTIVITAQDQASGVLGKVGAAMGNLGSQSAALTGLMGGLTGALSVGAFTGWIKGTIDAADTMNDLSQSVGIGIKELAGWQLAANQSGTSIESVARGVKGLSGYMVEHADKLKAAGITATDANGAMLQLADLFAAMPDGVEKTTLAVKLFGKSGMEMIPMLNQGSAGLQTSQEKAKAYADRLAELAPKADEFNDLIEELGLQSKVAGMNITEFFLPGLIGMATWLNDIAKGGESARAALDWLVDGSLLPPGLRGAAKGARSLYDGFRFLNDGDPLAGVEGTEAARKAAWSSRMVAGQGAAAVGLTGAQREAAARAQGLLAGDDKPSKARVTTAADIARQLPDWIATHQSDKWKTLQEQQEQGVARLIEKYKALADPLKQYRDALVEINALREDGLSAEEAWQAEQRVMQAMEDTREQMAGLKEDGQDTFADLTRAVEGWGDAFTDSLADMLMEGKLSFSSLADSIIRDLLRMQIQASITKPLLGFATGAIDHLMGGGSLFGPTGIFATKGSQPYVGGIDAVNGLDLGLPSFAVGTPYVPHDMVAQIHKGERIVPAAENRAGGMDSAPVINLTINNEAGAQVSATTRNNDGNLDVDILVARAIASDMQRNGPITQGFGNAFGLQRAI